MILMCVRQRYNIQCLEAASPQIRRYSFLSWVDAKTRFPTRETAKCATAVHEQGLAAGRHDEQRIALAYIEHAYFQLSRSPIRLEREYGNHERKSDPG